MNLKEQLVATLERASGLAANAEGENRDFTADERNQAKTLLEEAKGLKAKVDAAAATAAGDAELRKAITDLGMGIELKGEKAEQAVARAAAAVKGGDGASIGERFLASPDFKNWMAQIAPGGHIPESAKGLISPPVGFKTLITGLSDTGAGAMVFNDVQAGLLGILRRPLTIRDIVTPGTTNSDTVEYVKVTSETNAAAPVAEATATGGSTGTKPESALALARATETVKTIAHWIPATKRALSDAGQIRTLIDSFLRYGLEEELEDQMVTGDGIGENFTGLMNLSGVQTQAFDTDLFTTTRKARTKARIVGRVNATAYLFHPNDWETIDLKKDNEARYYFGGPTAVMNPRLWSLPVVESEAMTQGTAFVGDFKQCVLWDREQASIQVSDSHSDFFIRNMVAILAEMRAAFGCLRPAGLVKIALS